MSIGFVIFIIICNALITLLPIICNILTNHHNNLTQQHHDFMQQMDIQQQMDMQQQ